MCNGNLDYFFGLALAFQTVVKHLTRRVLMLGCPTAQVQQSPDDWAADFADMPFAFNARTRLVRVLNRYRTKQSF
jgi:hypothetical protein